MTDEDMTQMECPESPDGQHCWHDLPVDPCLTGSEVREDDQVCCWCQATRKAHGPHVPRSRDPLDIKF